MAVLQLPAFLHLVRGTHGELAQALVVQVARWGYTSSWPWASHLTPTLTLTLTLSLTLSLTLP